MSVQEKMTAIADAIREKTGKNDKLDLDAMAEGVTQVYDAGYEQGQAAGYQEGSERGMDAVLKEMNSLNYFFSSGYNMHLLPRVLAADLSGIQRAQYTFIDNTVITEFHTPDTFKPSQPHGFFQRATSLTRVTGLHGLPAGAVLTDLFNGCTSLVDGGTLNFQDVRYATRTFQNCRALQQIQVVGSIGLSIDLHWSVQLSRESIESIVNALSATTNGLTLTLSAAAVTAAFGSTAAQAWTELIATKSNWTVALT